VGKNMQIVDDIQYLHGGGPHIFSGFIYIMWHNFDVKCRLEAEKIVVYKKNIYISSKLYFGYNSGHIFKFHEIWGFVIVKTTQQQLKKKTSKLCFLLNNLLLLD
jgi:hypothetical protein